MDGYEGITYSRTTAQAPSLPIRFCDHCVVWGCISTAVSGGSTGYHAFPYPEYGPLYHLSPQLQCAPAPSTDKPSSTDPVAQTDPVTQTDPVAQTDQVTQTQT
jgi:hypothetical protein